MLALNLLLITSRIDGPTVAAKKPLDHSVYDGWQSIRGSTLSDDGKSIAYGIYPQEGDGMLYVYETGHPKLGAAKYSIERGNVVRFSGDSRFLIVSLVERRNRKDLSIRLSQFFDHHLKGAPMPMWMSKGVPAVNKGKDYGLDLEPGGL